MQGLKVGQGCEEHTLLWLCALLGVVAGFQHPLVRMPDSVYDYCKLSCSDSSLKNVACTRKECDVDPYTAELPWDFGLRKDSLDHLNTMRNQLAHAPAPTQHQDWDAAQNKYINTTRTYSKAANMRMLSYDTELEFQIACYLHAGYEKIEYCCGTEKWPSIRPILTVLNNAITMSSTELVKAGIDSWYKDYSYLSAENYLKYPSNSNLSGYVKDFTQFGWAKSTRAGCYVVGLTNSTGGLFGCLLAPEGLVADEPIYEPGDDLKCPDGTKPNERFDRLCGEQESWPPGSTYVGNVLLEERKLYWHPDQKRKIKSGEADMDAGGTIVCTHLGMTLLTFSLLYLLNSQ